MTKKALIVDDFRGSRLLLTKLLQNRGFQTEAKEDAEAALETLETDSFDLLITDLNMPGMDGFSFIKIIREKLGLGSNKLKIIFSSTDSRRESVGLAKQLGADAYYTKPFDEKRFMHVVEQLMK